MNKKFIVKGRFYNLQVNNKNYIKCRSLLEIKTSVEVEKVDAIVVMMNPGASKPCDENYTYTKLQKNQIKTNALSAIQLVDTVPDKTQTQIMCIMEARQWSYVKVINLSDISEPKSTKLHNKTEQVNSDIHSIFSKDRVDELKNIINDNKVDDIKVIVAWGVNQKLKKLIRLALNSKQLNNRVGWSKSNCKVENNFYYYHPLQRSKIRQEMWVEEIKSLI